MTTIYIDSKKLFEKLFEHNGRHPWGITPNNQQLVVPTTMQVDCNKPYQWLYRKVWKNKCNIISSPFVIRYFYPIIMLQYLPKSFALTEILHNIYIKAKRRCNLFLIVFIYSYKFHQLMQPK